VVLLIWQISSIFDVYFLFLLSNYVTKVSIDMTFCSTKTWMLLEMSVKWKRLSHNDGLFQAQKRMISSKYLHFLWMMFLWRISRQKSRKSNNLVNDEESIVSEQSKSRQMLCATCPWSCKHSLGNWSCTVHNTPWKSCRKY